MAVVRRARPLLGTLVEIRADSFGDETQALAAVEAAFAEIAVVHRLMSFHESGSDVSRLNREAAANVVDVDSRTAEVLDFALRLAAESDGAFDPSIGHLLVAWNLLPRPESPNYPDPGATWRDIERIGARGLSFHRPLWIDLGGIAKGYAVDRAVAILQGAGVGQGCVNAGGDLRVFGERAETVDVRLPHEPTRTITMLEVADGAVATSAGCAERRRVRGRWLGPHVHGRRRVGVAASGSVSVIAPRCMIADALTKVVLSDPHSCVPLLRRHDAWACVYDEQGGWHSLGAAA